jgi:hypothetical protein
MQWPAESARELNHAAVLCHAPDDSPSGLLGAQPEAVSLGARGGRKTWANNGDSNAGAGKIDSESSGERLKRRF